MDGKVRRLIPENITGYEFEPSEFGEFSVVLQDTAINLVRNPRFGYFANRTINYTGVNASVAATGYPYVGEAAGRVTPTNPALDASIRTPCITTGTGKHIFSAFIKGEPGKWYSVSVNTYPGMVLIARKRFRVSNAEYIRQYISCELSVTGTYYVAVTKEGGQGSGSFDTDAWQFERNSHLTTYFDGYSQGFLYKTQEYKWRGPANNSTSYRAAITNSGGREINFSDLGIRVYGVAGLGVVPVENVFQPLSTGGSFYQKTQVQNREFNINCAVFGKSVPDIRARMHDINQIFNPGRAFIDQPILLRFRKPNSGKVVNIPALYSSGLTGAIDSYYQQRMSMAFTQNQPIIENEGVTYATGTAQVSVVANSIFMKIAGGSWQSIGELRNGGGPTDEVRRIGKGPDGKIYVAGTFASINGDATLHDIARYDPDSATWEKMPGAIEIYDVYSFVFVRDEIYACGNFTIGGVNYLARMNVFTGAVWANAAFTPNLLVNDLACDDDTTLYMCGTFTNYAGIAAADYVAKLNVLTGVASAVGSGFAPSASTQASKIAVLTPATGDSVTEVFIGENKTVATDGVVVWHYDGSSWSNIGLLESTPGGAISAIEGLYTNQSKDRVIVYGMFDTIDSEEYLCIAYFENEEWYPFGAGVGNNATNDIVLDITQVPGTQTFLACGEFSTAGGYALDDNVFEFDSGNWYAWSAPDVGIGWQTTAIFCDEYKTVFLANVGANPNVNDTVLQPVSFTNPGTQESYGIIKITNVGLTNSTIKKIYSVNDQVNIPINNYVMKPGEEIYFNMAFTRIIGVSSSGKNLAKWINPGAFPMRFAPGENIIEVSKRGADITVEFYWKERYASLEDI